MIIFFFCVQTTAFMKAILDLADRKNSFPDGFTIEPTVFANNFCTGDAKGIVTGFILERNANSSVEAPKVMLSLIFNAVIENLLLHSKLFS